MGEHKLKASLKSALDTMYDENNKVEGIHIVKPRTQDRRGEQKPYLGANKRTGDRREKRILTREESLQKELDAYKAAYNRKTEQEKATRVSTGEHVVYYCSLFLSATTIFGFLTVVALYGHS